MGHGPGVDYLTIEGMVRESTPRQDQGENRKNGDRGESWDVFRSGSTLLSL
jgi:hypothetical protein